MSRGKKGIADARKRFKEYVNDALRNDRLLSQFLRTTKQDPLKDHYRCSTSSNNTPILFSCESGSFARRIQQSMPEKSYIDLIRHKDPNLNILDVLTESDLIKYFIALKAAEYKFKNEKTTDWREIFVALLKEKLLEDKLRSLEQDMIHNQAYRSAAQQKLLANLIEILKTSHEPIELRIKKCHELLLIVQNGTLNALENNPTFSQYSEMIAEAEYEHRYQLLQEKVQPTLYYPQSSGQQRNILKKCRHCYYVDYHDNNKLYYINLNGTPIKIKSSYLLTKSIEEAKINASGTSRVLAYKKEKYTTPAHLHVPFSYSEAFGHALHLTNDKMKLVIEDFHPDTIVDLAQDILKKLQLDRLFLHNNFSIFSNKKSLSNSQRRLVLTVAEQIFMANPTREVRLYTQKPDVQSFDGKGSNFYMFVDDVNDRGQTGFWHVDRSSDTPKLTRFPLDVFQADQLRYLFAGAHNLEAPKQTYAKYDTYLSWYNLGKKVENKSILESETHIQLAPQDAKIIPDLFLSDITLCDNIVKDWSYNESYDRLNNTLLIVEEKESNRIILERCRRIQHLLEKISEDWQAVFTKTRGLIPHTQREKIMTMMDVLITDPKDSKAKHYFRTKHRLYTQHLGFVPTAADCEPSSFIFENNILYYIDESHNQILVPMTSEILKTIHMIEQKHEEYISADEVYRLMTRPKSFYYFYGIPIFLNCTFQYKFFVPIGFDRSVGLHTGTAREMMCELHDMNISVRSVLYRIGNLILFVGVPLLLDAFGLGLPVRLILNAAQSAIFEWVMMCWNISWVYHTLMSIVFKNDLMQPEFTQLDKQLKELGDNIEGGLTHLRSERVIPEDIEDFDETSTFLNSRYGTL